MSSTSASSVAGSAIQRSRSASVDAGVARGALDRVRLVEQLAAEVPHPQAAQQRARRSGAFRRAATTARQAGTMADIRGRTAVSIGMPWSWAMRRKASEAARG